MNLPYSYPKWSDAKIKIHRPVSPPLFSAPIEATTARYLLKQDIEVHLNQFSPLALNTKHPNYPTYVLVREGDFEPRNGGVVRYTRTYAQVPASYSDRENFGAQFIGVTFSTTSPPPTWPTVFTRDPYGRRVSSRIQFDFFLVGQTFTPTSDNYEAGVADANATSSGPGTVAAPYDVFGSIPFLFSILYVSQANFSSTWYGGLAWNATYLSATTVPTAATYQKMVNDARANGWSATVTAQNLTVLSAAQTIINPQSTDPVTTPTPNSVYGGQICAEDSNTTRWMGNIYIRRTRYVLAE